MISLITYFKSVSLSIISYYEKILILEIFFTISSHLISSHLMNDLRNWFRVAIFMTISTLKIV
jgi:hypothetical protein